MDTRSANVPTKPKAYSYIRFSTPEQGQGDSLNRQLGLARAYAQGHGIDLDEGLTLRDLGKSAYRGANARTGALGGFLAAIDAGLVPQGSLLLVESLDRVTRQDPWDALPVFQQIINAGVTIVTLQDQKAYSQEEMRANPLRILESLFVMIRANEESATKSRRIKASWTTKRANAAHKPLTARTPAWLWLNKEARRFEVVEERGAVVRRIFKMAASGVGQHKIAETLNREQVPVFGRGKQWHRSYVAKTLKNPAAIGTLIPHEMDFTKGKKRRKAISGGTVEGYYPAVVDADLFHRVNALARSPSRGRHAGVAVVNVLGGIGKCSGLGMNVCGSSMIMVSKGNGLRYLVCSRAKQGLGCEYRAVRYDAVERSLVTHAERIVTPHADDPGDAFLVEHPLVVRQATLSADIEHLADEIERNGPSPTISRRLREAEQELEEAEAALAAELQKQFQTRPEYVEKVRGELVAGLREPEIDRGEVNACMRALFKEAIVNVAGNTLQLVWKAGQSTVLLLRGGDEKSAHPRIRATKKIAEEPWGAKDIDPDMRT